MSEWQETTLGELITLQRGHDLAKTEMQIGGIPVAGSNGVIGYHNKATTKGIGITIGRSGNIGNAYLYKKDFWAHNTTLYVKDFKGNDEVFVYYLLKSIDFGGFNVGSAVPTLNRNHIHPMVIQKPEVSEQKAIASVLSSLDDKIDLLHRQNTTLERMAETLFRQWFVEEAQEDWEELPLGEVATVQNGYAFSSSDYVDFQEDFLEVFKMGHIQPGGGLRFAPKADFVPRSDKLKRWVLNKNDIVMAMTDMKDNMGILGHPALIDISDKYALNQRVARIYLESSNKLCSIYLLYLQLSTEEAISLLQSKANSGVQVNLTTEAIKSIPITIPPALIQNRVLKTIQPIFEKLNINRTQIQTLEKLRDNLLPKLMSGEMRINLV